VPEKKFAKSTIELHQLRPLPPKERLSISQVIPHCAGVGFCGDNEMVNTPIIAFYSDTEPDHRGRFLHEIQEWPDDQLETVHYYIQRLFPLPDRCGFNVAATVPTPDSMQEFLTGRSGPSLSYPNPRCRIFHSSPPEPFPCCGIRRRVVTSRFRGGAVRTSVSGL
jgi:hypothetical protein